MYMHISLLQHTYIISLYKVHNTEDGDCRQSPYTIHSTHSTLIISAYKVHNTDVVH